MPVRELLPCGRDGADRLRPRQTLSCWLIVHGQSLPCGELLPAGERGCVSRPDRLPVRILLPRRLDRGYALLAGLPVPERIQDQGLLAVPRGLVLPGPARWKLPDCDSVSLRELLSSWLVCSAALHGWVLLPERILGR